MLSPARYAELLHDQAMPIASSLPSWEMILISVESLLSTGHHSVLYHHPLRYTLIPPTRR
jgi:hypothetical protein